MPVDGIYMILSGSVKRIKETWQRQQGLANTELELEEKVADVETDHAEDEDHLLIKDK